MLIINTRPLSLSVFFFSLLFAVSPVESQSPSKAPPGEKAVQFDDSFYLQQKKLSAFNKKWGVIDGFRSAKFGMTEKQLRRAITKDFKVSKNKVDRVELPGSEHAALVIRSIPSLMEVGGPADIVYILGPKSKGLVRVNLDWGAGVTKNFDQQDVIIAGHLLQNYFAKKRYKKKNFLVDIQVDNTERILFRGTDKKDRTVLLRLKKNKTKTGDNKKEPVKDMSLLLSYILKAEKPAN
jgi:hypothetical protein